MRYFYTIPVPERQADREQGSLRQRLAQEGLLGQGGRAVEQIALDEDTVRLTGNWRYGDPIDAKIARELESFGESNFGAVPLFASDRALERAGYYEPERVDVSPAHPGTTAVWDFTAELTLSGTQETEWRALRTNPQDAANPFDDGSDPLVYLDAEADKVAWYSQSAGKDPASPTATVETEYATMDAYDPSNTSISEPTLLFELAFDREGRGDVVVWDDRDRAKTESFAGKDVTVWQHVFHTGWEREGSFVVSNGRLRVTFNEGTGELEPERWTTADGWTADPLTYGSWSLLDATPERINAVGATFYVEFTDGSQLVPLYATLTRGASDILWREPDNVVAPQGLLDVVEPIALGWTTALEPAQGTKSRGDVEEQ